MNLEKLHEEDTKKLLPGSKSKAADGQDKRSFAFKCFIIVQMTFIWTGYTITVRYTRSTTPEHLRYSATTVVCLAELIKLFIALCCIYQTNQYSVKAFIKCMKEEYFGKPLDLLKMSIPSMVYTLQNNLDFVALSNLDAGIYQVTTQLKVITTAIFMMVILGWQFSRTRWLSIFLLFCGVAAVQFSVSEGGTQMKGDESYIIGLSAVLLTCVTAGFAGVYFEWMLKNGSKTPFWIRNFQMYSSGVISAALGCFLSEWDKIVTKGFFYGYDSKVASIILLLSLGGIFISLVVKYLNNLYKSFASAVSIILVVIISYVLFQDVQLNLSFVVGSITVCGAILLYNSVPE